MPRSLIFFVPLVFAATLIFVGLYFWYPKSSPNFVIAVNPAITPILSPTSTPTPTPTAIPIPTAKPTPKPTPKPTSKPAGVSSGSQSVSTPKGTFTATVLSFDLSRTKVITDTGNDDNCGNNCTVMPLANYVAKNGGISGVNGTYFCPDTYPDCAGKTNSYDFPVYNTRLGKWINRDKLGWNERRAIFYVDGSGAHYQNSSAGFSGGLTAGIINYPGLLDGGNVQIDDNQSGLSDKQRAVGTKVGIGVIDNNHVIVVVAQGVNMQQFAYVFQSLGAKGALNLDTGGSTALISNGRYLYGPGRGLPNAIIFANK
jgi:hypothetical protein